MQQKVMSVESSGVVVLKNCSNADFAEGEGHQAAESRRRGRFAQDDENNMCRRRVVKQVG